MSVTKEEGGRLNAFAKEPKIQVLTEEGRNSNKSWLITIIGIVVLVGCIAIAFGIS